MQELFQDIISNAIAFRPKGEIIGYTRGHRPLRAHRFGRGEFLISLIAGCHADEPVGPRLLDRLVVYLDQLAPNSSLLKDYQWWIVPHANPDGEEVNKQWFAGHDDAMDLVQYLTHHKRELPGDDMEFGFPRNEDDIDARPENRSIAKWWQKAGQSFKLHVSLHGMAFAAGPWFLIEPTWASRCELIKTVCRKAVDEMGYRLHDVDRQGEKGFYRLEEGFCTRPDSEAMAQHFSDHQDESTACKFRPSSMEVIRTLGDDVLTLVSEMPLFLLPNVGETLGPPDPEALLWKQRIEMWKAQLIRGGKAEDLIREEARGHGIEAMSIQDQMQLQWTFIVAGVRQAQVNATQK
ncbi:MAG: M14 family zinc carboxypeptidase [Acidobacteriota bacterium]|nr:M14 family zinc carboxypeptidase [Acidobacteriota bacterium]